jgi:hypothetical protein
MKLIQKVHFLGLAAALILTACGGGGGSSSSSDSQTVQPAADYIEINGAGIKGPLAFATAKIYAVDPAFPEFFDPSSPISSAISDSTAAIRGLTVPRKIRPPYILTFGGSNAIDLNTGTAPVISTLVTVITEDMLVNNRPIFATPLTTLVYDMARHGAAATANVDAFLQQVSTASTQVSELFAIDPGTKIDVTGSPLMINKDTRTLAQQKEAVYHRAAVEAFAAKAYMLSMAKGDGLRGTYFNTLSLSNPALERVDASVNFSWGGKAPDPRVNADGFSVRWTGFIEPDYSETYSFYTSTDDGVRLWVNGQLIVDHWVDQFTQEYTASIPLVAGKKYPIVMEYYDNTGGAAARLSWSSASQTKTVIPKRNLYSAADAASLQAVNADEIIDRLAVDLQSDGTIDARANGSIVPGIDPGVIALNPMTMLIPNTPYRIQDIMALMEDERVLLGTDKNPEFFSNAITLPAAETTTAPAPTPDPVVEPTPEPTPDPVVEPDPVL